MADTYATRALGLVNRHFTVGRPDVLWLTHLTDVSTRSGMAYACFGVDADVDEPSHWQWEYDTF